MLDIISPLLGVICCCWSYFDKLRQTLNWIRNLPHLLYNTSSVVTLQFTETLLLSSPPFIDIRNCPSIQLPMFFLKGGWVVNKCRVWRECGWELSVVCEGWECVSCVKRGWVGNKCRVWKEGGWKLSGVCEGKAGGNMCRVWRGTQAVQLKTFLEGYENVEDTDQSHTLVVELYNIFVGNENG